MGKGAEATKGALGGAATGAAIGSVVPVIGTGVGAIGGGVLGGLAGWFGTDDEPSQWADVDRSNFDLPYFQDMYGQRGAYEREAAGRRAERLRAQQTGAYSDFRGQQQQLGNLLMAQAQGRGPGQELVRMHAQEAADRGARQQLAMARSMGGGALAARNAAMAQSQMQSQVGQQAAMGGLQAQLGAAQQAGGVLQGARGLDFQHALENARLRQQSGQFNVQSAMQQQQMNDAFRMAMLQQQMGLAQLQQQGGMGYEQARTARYAADQGVAANQPGMGSQLLGAGAGALDAYLQYKAGTAKKG